jgi:hypothetical protein
LQEISEWTARSLKNMEKGSLANAR